MSGFKQQPKGFATKAIHVGQDPENWNHLAVVPPIVMSTTFKQFKPAEPKVIIFVTFFCNIFRVNVVRNCMCFTYVNSKPELLLAILLFIIIIIIISWTVLYWHITSILYIFRVCEWIPHDFHIDASAFQWIFISVSVKTENVYNVIFFRWKFQISVYSCFFFFKSIAPIWKEHKMERQKKAFKFEYHYGSFICITTRLFLSEYFHKITSHSPYQFYGCCWCFFFVLKRLDIFFLFVAKFNPICKCNYCLSFVQ